MILRDIARTLWLADSRGADKHDNLFYFFFLKESSFPQNAVARTMQVSLRVSTRNGLIARIFAEQMAMRTRYNA